jgi:hypothetical protein
MSEVKRTLKRLTIDSENTYLLMENEPGTDLTETIEAWLILNADDDAPIWRHKVSALRRAGNLLHALAAEIEAANGED